MTVPGCANPLLMYGDAGSYQIQRSLRFNSSDSASLSRASYAGSGTFSCWVKRCKLGTAQTIISGVAFNASDQLNSSAAVFRDPSAWMHVLVSTSGTYVNGTSVASGSAITPGIIGSGCDLYLANIHFIDGQALTPSSFTEVSATTGQLVPKAYTGTFTGNSFWLKFSDNSSTTSGSNVGIGKDFSGLGNYWNSTNLSVTAGAGNDSLVDTPTSYGTDTGAGGEVRGNYATLNPLDRSSNVTLANGNLDWSNSSAGNVRGTVSFNGGKFYCEATASTAGSYGFGIGKADSSLSGNFGAGITGVYAWRWDGAVYKFHSSGSEPWSASGSSSDVLQIAIDASNPASVKLFLGRQNTWYDSSGGTTANPATGANPTATLTDNVNWFLFTGGGNISNAVSVNMGQRAFAYTAPSGFKALCDTNLTAPVVAKPNQHFDIITYPGNGSTQTIPNATSTPATALDFGGVGQIGFSWIKQRSDPSTSHAIYDARRGVQARLESDTVDQEATSDNGVTAFNAGTIALGSQAQANSSSETYVAWCWATADQDSSSHTQGSITSSVRANPTAGFSIVSFNSGSSGAKTIGHGLGIAPSLIIAKNRDGSANWTVYHSAATTVSQFLMLNSTNAVGSSSNIWGSAAPTSTVFGFDSGTNQAANANIIAYCFAPVVGYSSFGSYTGTGTGDGPFVYTGHRSRWVLIKDTGSGNWRIYDTARDLYNQATAKLYPNSSTSENGVSGETASTNTLDMLSNGFKLRTSNSETNFSGNTYIWASFAENPFQYARAR